MFTNVGLVVIGFVLAGLALYNDRKKRLYMQMFYRQRDIRDTLQQQDYLSLSYIDALEDYTEQVTLLNVDLHDTLIDKANEVKMLKSQTVELPEVKPAPKRTTRPKKGSTA